MGAFERPSQFICLKKTWKQQMFAIQFKKLLRFPLFFFQTANLSLCETRLATTFQFHYSHRNNRTIALKFSPFQPITRNKRIVLRYACVDGPETMLLSWQIAFWIIFGLFCTSLIRNHMKISSFRLSRLNPFQYRSEQQDTMKFTSGNAACLLRSQICGSSSRFLDRSETK